MQDDRTQHLNLPLPHKDNTLDEDLPRLRAALAGLDDAAGQAAAAQGRYQTIDADAPEPEISLDLNEYFLEPTRLYFVGMAGVVNLPPGVGLPIYFDLAVDDQNASASQTVSDGDSVVWMRTGAVTLDPNDVDWGDWVRQTNKREQISDSVTSPDSGVAASS
ncbi:MAG: hypothetical protein FWF31_09000, partial [Desulfobulbus sp.]|nr:hypothetical protein [Desulfobulbus sp.]